MPDCRKLGVKTVIHCVIILHQHSNLKAACSYLIIEKKLYYQQTHNLQAFLFPAETLFNMITRISVSTTECMYLLHMGSIRDPT